MSIPAASMRGPPMPTKSSCGMRPRSAVISCPPSRSPDASPATMPTVCRRAPDSADNATRGELEKIYQPPELGARVGLFGDFLHCFLEPQPRFVQRFVSALDADDGVGREAAPLEPFPVDAIRLGSIAGCRHERRYVLQHHCADRGNAMGTDAAELVHCREAAEDRIIADVHVA